MVVPVAYAVKGSPHARHLWQYKSAGRTDAEPAASLLQALALVFLREHGACLRRMAGATATHLAVVPTARGRPGTHPLRSLVEPYLIRPWADLAARPGGEQCRDLDPARFSAGPLPGARVLLLDDTWTTGASAQSAAMALRRAGARSVVVVVLGRHIGRAAGGLTAVGTAAMPFRADSCAVHDDDALAVRP
ncbi:MAG TPA: phosphoribosyltransferase [Streptosporangiaceae bacterium]|nr:phosphoribosyltransferase [Streptosporangiaceae bacterium]